MYNLTHNAKETEQLLIKSVLSCADLVKSTLGPGGRPVIIQGAKGTRTVITKDGVSVANAIRHYNSAMQLGVTLLTAAAKDANRRGGDGTTTCTVLASELIRALCEYTGHTRIVAANEIREWLPKAIDIVTNNFAIPCKDLELLTSVTAISANGDRYMGELIATAMLESEGRATITVVNNGVTSDSIVKVEEAQWAATFSTVDREVKFNEVRLAVIHGTLTCEQLGSMSARSARDANKLPTIILCEKIESGASVSLNRLAKHGVFVGVMPGTVLVRQTHLEDIINIFEVEGNDITVEWPDLKTITLNGSVSIRNKRLSIKLNEAAHNRRLQLVSTINDILDVNHADARQRKLLQSRLDIWSPNYYELDMAAVSEYERKERFDRAEDCINACRNAFNKGVIPGGGTIGMYLINLLPTMDLSEEAIDVLEVMLKAPFRTICDNMGHEESFATAKIALFDTKYSDTTSDISYNAITDTFNSCLEQQILDPVEVFLSSLESAISLGLTVATTGGSLIIDTNYYRAVDEDEQY